LGPSAKLFATVLLLAAIQNLGHGTAAALSSAIAWAAFVAVGLLFAVIFEELRYGTAALSPFKLDAFSPLPAATLVCGAFALLEVASDHGADS